MAISFGDEIEVIVDGEGNLRIGSKDMPLVPKQGEKHLDWVRSLEISIVPDDLVRAKTEVYLNLSEIKAKGDFSFFGQDPHDGFKTKQVARIEFTDGSVWDWEG